MNDPKIFIFANGNLRDLDFVKSMISPGDLIIAADGGGMHLAAAGLIPDVVIGDMDSIAPGVLAKFENSGSQILRYPVEKDETDLELAMELALQKGWKKWVIAAGLGGRMDQTLGNLNLLTHADLEQVEVRLEDGVEEAWFFQNETTSIRGSIGDVVSLLPWGAAAVGITTSGLKYPLINETLYPDKTRGISNILMSETASVVVGSGRLLCIHTRN